MFKRKKLKPEQTYREQRMAEIVELFDKWVIEVAISDDEKVYIPHPMWDDEWLLTRPMFPTWDEARTEVLAQGGAMLKDAEGNLL